MSDDFYIGYLPKAPARTARFTRRAVAAAGIATLFAGGALAVALPYYGNGVFEFGRHQDFVGTMRCDTVPQLKTDAADYVLVGYGKNRAPIELCGAAGQQVKINGTLITREGRQLIEVSSSEEIRSAAAPSVPSQRQSLGRATLTGEIVDSKCYFGVMNPAEGRAHRACAELCLKGGVPAVFVARDRTGATAHLIITQTNGKPMNDQLLRWAAESVEATGEVVRQGKWLIFRVDPTSLKPAGNVR